MRYISTRDHKVNVSLSEALQQGLAADGGLYVPEFFPKMLWDDFDPQVSFQDFAKTLLSPFFDEDSLLENLPDIIKESLNFPVLVDQLDAQHFVLELFHGPTLSFKDFGARFLASCLSRISSDKPYTILVATSGDTGSAVASAFHNKPNIKVVVLFPEGKISKRQEQQITCWGDNVLAVAVDGSFDDCQRLVKTAFGLDWWHQRAHLNTSNSINIGRLLPQMTYYAFSAWRYYLMSRHNANFIVPSGNLGNVCAAFWAREIGFPIDEVSLSQNENNAVGHYLADGEYHPAPSIGTLANAMDVGAPSNLERLMYLFGDFEHFAANVSVTKVSDDDIRQTIAEVYENHHEIICPHTATAFFAMSQKPEKPRILVATAHPSKFEGVIEPILGREILPPPKLKALLGRPQHKVDISADMASLMQAYEDYFK